MKIMLVANKDITLYLFRKEFVEELLKLKHKVFILCPYGEKLEYFRTIGCTLIDYKVDRRGKSILNEIKLLRRVVKVLQEYRPTRIFTYTVKPNIYVGLACHLTRLSFVPTITGLGTSLSKKGFLSFLVRLLYKISFRKADSIVFQNQSNQEWFRENISRRFNSVLVKGSGINLSQYNYRKLDQGVTRFLFLGRIMKEKGIEEYIEASEKLKRKYGNRIRFEIAGFFEEDYKSIVDDLVDNGVVTYHGFLENTYNAIARCTVVVLPSYHEGLSNVLLEAQAVGRPVIASRVPGCTETFIDGISGVSVTPRDSNDLLEKMEYMFNLDYDQKLHMGELGRKHVESQFDRTEVVNQYIKLT